jgi:hypothetical protein
MAHRQSMSTQQAEPSAQEGGVANGALRTWASAGLGATARAALEDGLPSSELWSLLLGVLERRARRRPPAELLRQWERDSFIRPAPVDQRTLVALDLQLLAAAPGFEALELSPLAPLGVCSAVAVASQNKIVSALRGTEVVSDPTNVMALECARRLRAEPQRVVRLATCHRCVRAQAVPQHSGFAQHFRIFCLASGARERQGHAFVVEALGEHITTQLAALDRLERYGYAFPERRIRILASSGRAALADRIASALPGANVVRETLAHAYYDGLRFMIDVRAPEGDHVPLIDGGAFNWLGKLTSNQRLVLVASGMGSQLAAMLFRA